MYNRSTKIIYNCDKKVPHGRGKLLSTAGK